MCICLYLSVSPCTITHHPFVGQNCKRIRQLQNWGPGRKTTSFADLPLTGQAVLFQSGFIHSRLEKWTEYDSEADDDDGGGDRRCSITGRLMFYPSAQPLCVNATLNYLVVSWYGECTLPLKRGTYSTEDREKRQDRESKSFSETVLSPACLAPFPPHACLELLDWYLPHRPQPRLRLQGCSFLNLD